MHVCGVVCVCVCVCVREGGEKGWAGDLKEFANLSNPGSYKDQEKHKLTS